MKLNLDFYHGSDLYSDGNIEQEIVAYTEQYSEAEFDKIFENDIRWPIFYHLSDIRKNILAWYPMKKEAQVLEIGAGMGAITSCLCEKAKKVTCVELSKQRATAIANRNKTRENLEIIVANLNDVKFEEKFDYITLIGVLEYAPLYTKAENPFVSFLLSIKRFLKTDGKLLIGIENKLGMKYFAGAPEDHTNRTYDGIEGYGDQANVQTFGKNELKELLKSVGLKHTQFYYPLPDYKLPNVIFSDEYLPNEAELSQYQVYYYEGTKIQFDEKKAYAQTIKNGVFDIFANSFLVEASAKKIKTNVDFKTFKFIPISENAKKFYEKSYFEKGENT